MANRSVVVLLSTQAGSVRFEARGPRLAALVEALTAPATKSAELLDGITDTEEE